MNFDALLIDNTGARRPASKAWCLNEPLDSQFHSPRAQRFGVWIFDLDCEPLFILISASSLLLPLISASSLLLPLISTFLLSALQFSEPVLAARLSATSSWTSSSQPSITSTAHGLQSVLREIGIRLQFGLVTAILGDAGAHSWSSGIPHRTLHHVRIAYSVAYTVAHNRPRRIIEPPLISASVSPFSLSIFGFCIDLKTRLAVRVSEEQDVYREQPILYFSQVRNHSIYHIIPQQSGLRITMQSARARTAA